MKIQIDEKLQGKALYDFLIENKTALIAQKKSETKRADAVSLRERLVVNENGHIVKAAQATMPNDIDSLEATVIINTTFWYDSHSDVHIDGLWKKSLKENKMNFHLQEHVMAFENIIADDTDVKALTKKIAWKELGVDANGETEALVFVSTIKKSRHPYMFDQYRQGHVKNHSVGMIYVDIALAVNDADYKEEFATWNKYIDKIANRADVEAEGYFFAVKEAKVVEGSAVVKGSNSITPTQSIKADTEKEPGSPTPEQPLIQPEKFDLLAAIKETKFLKH